MKNKEHHKKLTISEDLTAADYQSLDEKLEDRDETNISKTHSLTITNMLEKKAAKLAHSSNDISEEENKFICSSKKKNTECSNDLNCDKSVNMKSTFSIEKLTADDEIYTFGYPENFSVKGLLDQKIFLDYVYKITDNESGDIFKLQVLDSESSFLTLALPSQKLGGCLVNLPLQGKILIQESKEMLSEYESVREEKTKNEVNFSEKMKVRHPLIGVDWKNHISLAETILKKRILKRKSEKVKTEVVGENQVLNNEISPRKKKEKKI